MALGYLQEGKIDQKKTRGSCPHGGEACTWPPPGNRWPSWPADFRWWLYVDWVFATSGIGCYQHWPYWLFSGEASALAVCGPDHADHPKCRTVPKKQILLTEMPKLSHKKKLICSAPLGLMFCSREKHQLGNSVQMVLEAWTFFSLGMFFLLCLVLFLGTHLF